MDVYLFICLLGVWVCLLVCFIVVIVLWLCGWVCGYIQFLELLVPVGLRCVVRFSGWC